MADIPGGKHTDLQSASQGVHALPVQTIHPLKIHPLTIQKNSEKHSQDYISVIAGNKKSYPLYLSAEFQ